MRRILLVLTVLVLIVTGLNMVHASGRLDALVFQIEEDELYVEIGLMEYGIAYAARGTSKLYKYLIGSGDTPTIVALRSGNRYIALEEYATHYKTYSSVGEAINRSSSLTDEKTESYKIIYGFDNLSNPILDITAAFLGVKINELLADGRSHEVAIPYSRAAEKLDGVTTDSVLSLEVKDKDDIKLVYVSKLESFYNNVSDYAEEEIEKARVTVQYLTADYLKVEIEEIETGEGVDCKVTISYPVAEEKLHVLATGSMLVLKVEDQDDIKLVYDAWEKSFSNIVSGYEKEEIEKARVTVQDVTAVCLGVRIDTGLEGSYKVTIPYSGVANVLYQVTTGAMLVLEVEGKDDIKLVYVAGIDSFSNNVSGYAEEEIEKARVTVQDIKAEHLGVRINQLPGLGYKVTIPYFRVAEKFNQVTTDAMLVLEVEGKEDIKLVYVAGIDSFSNNVSDYTPEEIQNARVRVQDITAVCLDVEIKKIEPGIEDVYNVAIAYSKAEEILDKVTIDAKLILKVEGKDDIELVYVENLKSFFQVAWGYTEEEIEKARLVIQLKYPLTLRSIPSAGGIISREGEYEGGYMAGEVVTITAKAEPGYIFLGWFKDDSLLSSTPRFSYTMPGQAVTLFALFKEGVEHVLDGVTFHMRLAPAATFPTGMNDNRSATVASNFWMAETPVTYELWHQVYSWATHVNRGVARYTFTNAGMEGSVTGGGGWPNYNNIGKNPTDARNEPVTMVTWGDTIVWLNALTEYYKAWHGTPYTPVYTLNGQVLRDASTANRNHEDVVANTGNGFRLPTSMEWELAARWRGSDSTNAVPGYADPYFTRGNSASGAVSGYYNAATTSEVAWYGDNSDTGSGEKTQPVGVKTPNALGLYDMSGNVWEWCFTQSGSRRVNRGGSWNYSAYNLQVGYYSDCVPSDAYPFLGFRPVRTQ